MLIEDEYKKMIKDIAYGIFNDDDDKCEIYKDDMEIYRFKCPLPYAPEGMSLYGYMEKQHTKDWVLRLYNRRGTYIGRMVHSWASIGEDNENERQFKIEKKEQKYKNKRGLKTC